MNFRELQQRGAELGVYERGMTQKELEAAVTEAESRDQRQVETERRGGGRVPYGSRRLNLEVPDRLKQDGLYYRFFRAENLERARAAGYFPVLDNGVAFDPDNREHEDRRAWYTVSKGRNEDGSPQSLFLMAQPEHFREEDKAIRKAELDSVDEALKRGNAEGVEAMGEAVYQPEKPRVSQIQN